MTLFSNKLNNTEGPSSVEKLTLKTNKQTKTENVVVENVVHF